MIDLGRFAIDYAILTVACIVAVWVLVGGYEGRND